MARRGAARRGEARPGAARLGLARQGFYTKKETVMKKTIGEISVDARLLYERMKQAQFGDVVEYHELTNIIKRNVQNSGYGAMQTARRRCLNEDMIVFDVIENVGLKRLNPAEIANCGESFVQRAKRVSRKGIRVISAITTDQFSALSNEDKVQHNTYRSVLGVIEHMSKPAAVKKIEGAVAREQAALPLIKTLELFG